MGKNNALRVRRYQLAKKDEMALLAGGEAKKHAEKLLVEQLSGDKQFATRIGVVMRRAREDFARAYPHETREKIIKNDELRRQGFHELADANELMNLAGI